MNLLPTNIIIKIYEYDLTYNLLFDKVIHQINSFSNNGLWWITRGFIPLKDNKFIKFNDENKDIICIDQYFYLQMSLGQMFNRKYRYTAIIDYFKLKNKVKKCYEEKKYTIT